MLCQDKVIIIFTEINIIIICFNTLFISVVEVTLLHCYVEVLIHLLVRTNRGVQ